MTSILSETTPSQLNNKGNNGSFTAVIYDLKAKMKLVFHDRDKIDKLETERG